MSKKIFRPFGPRSQFGLKIGGGGGGGRGGGTRPPPLDPPLLTKASWHFQRSHIYLGKVTFLILCGLLIAEDQPKHSTDERPRNPPFLKEICHVHRAC